MRVNGFLGWHFVMMSAMFWSELTLTSVTCWCLTAWRAKKHLPERWRFLRVRPMSCVMDMQGWLSSISGVGLCCFQPIHFTILRSQRTSRTHSTVAVPVAVEIVSDVTGDVLPRGISVRLQLCRSIAAVKDGVILVVNDIRHESQERLVVFFRRIGHDTPQLRSDVADFWAGGIRQPRTLSQHLPERRPVDRLGWALAPVDVVPGDERQCDILPSRRP